MYLFITPHPIYACLNTSVVGLDHHLYGHKPMELKNSGYATIIITLLIIIIKMNPDRHIKQNKIEIRNAFLSRAVHDFMRDKGIQNDEDSTFQKVDQCHEIFIIIG